MDVVNVSIDWSNQVYSLLCTSTNGVLTTSDGCVRCDIITFLHVDIDNGGCQFEPIENDVSVSIGIPTIEINVIICIAGVTWIEWVLECCSVVL